MNKVISVRLALMFVLIGLLGFAAFQTFPAKAAPIQGKACQEESAGWENAVGKDVDLEGSWTISKSTDCKDRWNWSSPMTISEEDGKLVAKAWNNNWTIQRSGVAVILTRDLGDFPKDKNGLNLQTFRGYIQESRDRKIRIFGHWVGAYDYLIPAGYNNEFKIYK